ncbi:MAG: FKBP-type peptidyl-prolyl cis-trans isomerase [Gemmatimonadaceae bacterium]
MQHRVLTTAFVLAGLLAGLLLAGVAACASRQTALERTTFGADAGVALSEMTWASPGYFYRDVEVGAGVEAAGGRTVRISYVVRLADGREVDRADRDAPVSFRIGEGRVIRALDAGIRGMRVGGARQLVVPPELGYGAQGAGPIPPHAVLVMLVRLESVENAR